MLVAEDEWVTQVKKSETRPRGRNCGRRGWTSPDLIVDDDVRRLLSRRQGGHKPMDPVASGSSSVPNPSGR